MIRVILYLPLYWAGPVVMYLQCIKNHCLALPRLLQPHIDWSRRQWSCGRWMTMGVSSFCGQAGENADPDAVVVTVDESCLGLDIHQQVDLKLTVWYFHRPQQQLRKSRVKCLVSRKLYSAERWSELCRGEFGLSQGQIVQLRTASFGRHDHRCKMKSLSVQQIPDDQVLSDVFEKAVIRTTLAQKEARGSC